MYRPVSQRTLALHIRTQVTQSNNSLPSTAALLVQLYNHINSRHRCQFGLLLGLTIFSSFAEVVSLSADMPFIGIFTQAEKVPASPALARVVQAMGVTSGAELVLPLTIGFVVAVLRSIIVRSTNPKACM